jgi:hypothetical protein
MKSKSVAATPPPQKVEATPRRPLAKRPLLSALTIAPGAAHPLFGDVASPLLLACAACTGKSDSSLAVGMNWGIVTLLGFVLTVLSCFIVFFVHVARRSPPADDDATQQCAPSINSPLVGTSRCDVPAREATGGRVAPLNAARTAQRAVPTTENTE